MFDVGFSEMVLLAIISLVVLGPERLPHAARLAGAWIGKARRIFFDLKHDIEAEVNAKELQQRLAKLQQKLDSSALEQTLNGKTLDAQMTDEKYHDDPQQDYSDFDHHDRADSLPTASSSTPNTQTLSS